MAISPDPVSSPPGEPGAGDERLARWEHRTRPLIIAAAVLPLLGVLTPGAPDAVVVFVAFSTWAVFVVDLVVHVRLRPGYLRTRSGLFDVFIVVTTFPWYLIGAGPNTGITQVFRLARLGRLAKVATTSPSLQRFLRRLGRPVLYVTVMLVACSFIVTRVEGPAEGFTGFGTGLWWGIVTLTTVGYGDLVPQTPVGRVVASVLMISGVALLGTVAASLASLFRTQDVPADEAETTSSVADLARQIDQLHEELRAVRRLLEAGEPPVSGPPGGPGEPGGPGVPGGPET